MKISHPRSLHTIRLLTHDEELELVEAWLTRQDPKAKDRLLLSHAALVQKLAKSYRGYGLPMHELIAEGFVGMTQALHKFDPHKGFRFSTYAMWWIKATMQQYIMNMWSLVKITGGRDMKKLFFKLRSTAKSLSAKSDHTTDQLQEALVRTLDVSPENLKLMQERLLNRDVALNAPLGAPDEGGTEWQDQIADDSANQEELLLAHDTLCKQRVILTKCLSSLSPREHKIIAKRRLEEPPYTLDQIARELNLSKERVRQIEAKAFEKIRQEALRHMLPEVKRKVNAA